MIALALGLLLLAIYLATNGYIFHMIDEIAMFSVARSLVGHGTFDGDILYWIKAPLGRGAIVSQGLNGHIYVIKDVASALLAVPLMWVAQLMGASSVRAAMMANPPVTALTAALLYLLIRDWGYDRKVALLGGLMFGLGTMAWPYAGMFYTQPIVGLGILIGLYGAFRAQQTGDWRPALLAGIGLGIGALGVVAAWSIGPALLVYLIPWEALHTESRQAVIKRSLRTVIPFGLGAGIFVIWQAVYNAVRFGSPFQTGYQQNAAADFSPLYFGLGSVGQLFSTPRGLIWFVPLVLLIPFGVVIGWRAKEKRRLIWLALAVFSLLFVVSSSYETWWAGLTWGPRHLMPMMPVLVLLTIPLLDRFVAVTPHDAPPSVSASSAPLARGANPALRGWARLLIGLVLVVSVGTQALTTAFNYLETEPDVSAELHRLTPPPSFIVRDPVLTDLRILPQARQIVAAEHGAWDVSWMVEGQADWLLLGIEVLVITVAMVWLVLAFRDGKSNLVRGGLIAQTVISIGLMVFVLLHFPDDPHAEPGLDAFVAEFTNHVQPGDGVITVLPSSYLAWLDSYNGKNPDVGFVYENPLIQESIELLEHTAQWYDRVWLVTEETVGGNPDNGVEVWLAEHGYIGVESWVEGYRMVAYSLPDDEPELDLVGQVFGDDEFELAGAAVDQVEAGWLNVYLRWEAISTEQTEDYTMFVHVLDQNGALVAQHDGKPMAGYAPTYTWKSGMIIDDRRNVPLPEPLPPGEYQVTIGAYHPLTGERLPLADGSGDVVVIGVIEVGAQ